MVPLGWKPTSKQKRTSQIKIYISKSKQLRKRGKTTNWQHNLSMHNNSCLYVKSNVLGTDGPTWVKHQPYVSRAKMVPFAWKINSKYLGHRWSHLGEEIISKYLGHRWSHLGEKIISKYLGHKWSHLGENRQQAKKNKSNENIYKEKQTIKETGENNKLA